jgi:very-short-patch-repair endonuclease
MNILFVIIIASIAVALLIALTLKRAHSDEMADFENRACLFTSAERSFLGVLEQALDGRYRVFGKVRLGDIIKTAKGLDVGKRVTALNKINQKHVDFVVCTASGLALVGVIELDDQSHGREDRTGRDIFVDKALAKAGIPLLRFPAKKGYSIQEVRTRLAEMMSGDTKSGVVSVAQEAIAPVKPVFVAILEGKSAQPVSAAPVCPKCSAVMVKRQAMKGSNAGKYFWACSTFPMCRQVKEAG